MRITEKGQITIPIDLRKRYGLGRNTEIEFVAGSDGIRITRRRGSQPVSRTARRGAARKRLNISVDQYIESIRGR